MLTLKEYENVVKQALRAGYKLAEKQTSIPDGSLLKIVRKPHGEISWVVKDRPLELEWSMTDRQDRGCSLTGDTFDFFLLGKDLIKIDDNEYFEAAARVYYKVLHEDKVAYIYKNEFFYENSKILAFLLFYKTP